MTGIYTLLGTSRYPLPAGTFKSMIFQLSLHGWDMYGYVGSLKGIPSTYLGSQATLPPVHIALLKERWWDEPYPLGIIILSTWSQTWGFIPWNKPYNIYIYIYKYIQRTLKIYVNIWNNDDNVLNAHVNSAGGISILQHFDVDMMSIKNTSWLVLCQNHKHLTCELQGSIVRCSF